MCGRRRHSRPGRKPEVPAQAGFSRSHGGFLCRAGGEVRAAAWCWSAISTLRHEADVWSHKQLLKIVSHAARKPRACLAFWTAASLLTWCVRRCRNPAFPGGVIARRIGAEEQSRTAAGSYLGHRRRAWRRRRSPAATASAFTSIAGPGTCHPITCGDGDDLREYSKREGNSWDVWTTRSPSSPAAGAAWAKRRCACLRKARRS